MKLQNVITFRLSILKAVIIALWAVCFYFAIIKEINKKGVTILLIEQNANMALRIADQGYVLETGRISLSGTGRELLEDESVKAAYLGKKKK